MARRKLEVGVREGVLKALAENQESIAQIAARFGVSVVTVYNWRKTLNTVVASSAHEAAR